MHCVGAGLVPARTAGGCGPQGGHKGRPYEGLPASQEKEQNAMEQENCAVTPPYII
jgi:hypothetical protein